MKTKEELLKIYSAYLPYELKLKLGEFESVYNLLSIDVEGNADIISENKYDLDTVGFDGIKPILYSMDMLTKEIEHKGERFIPVDYLMKMRSVNPDSFCCDTRKQKAIHALLNDLKVTNRISIDMFNKLLDWNFNVFGLDESEFIKK